ncbi:MAG TPA: DUF3095 family protein [Ensifer sp.]|jgi:hypothetical protein|uniref:DUF3095 family protein n=1 Tax=Ensifer sp. TaxID=1872086 RepID=UPI002E0FA832|nr:DUF3095 family protein [Ensifer sp.]
MYIEPQGVQAHSEFSRMLDPGIYEPLPGDWLIGITDIVDSTLAIRAGRYEDVNYTGASAIAAIGNAWGSFDFPFVFRGDGAAFALPPEGREMAAMALRQLAVFVRDRFDLELRVGLLTVDEIRAGGQDVRIARYAASTEATYAMFAGGGLKWAEQQLKQGRYRLAPEAAKGEPDLAGLACEWRPFPSRQGLILSLLVEPADNADPERFTALAREVMAVFDEAPRQSHPLPSEMGVPKDPRVHVEPARWAGVAANSDFRKYDDGLRLTVDCTVGQIDRVESILVAAKARGEVNFGLHRQSHALMTCLVPSARPDAHLHFLDGMDGGYARAAEMMEPRKRLAL